MSLSVILLKYAEIEEALENIDNYASFNAGRVKANHLYNLSSFTCKMKIFHDMLN